MNSQNFYFVLLLSKYVVKVRYEAVVSSWSIANNFVQDFYCRCLEILCQIALSSLANYFRSYSLLQFGIKSVLSWLKYVVVSRYPTFAEGLQKTTMGGGVHVSKIQARSHTQ